MNSPLLEIKQISVSFDGFLALNDLNLVLNKGDLRAVIGPNGAGKTTFLDVITGKVVPTKGDVIFKDKSLIGQKEYRIARKGIGRKFQSPRIFENLSVQENLALSVSRPKTPSGSAVTTRINNPPCINIQLAGSASLTKLFA